MVRNDMMQMAIRLLLALAVIGVVVGGASGSAAACDHWLQQPEDEPETCTNSLTHEFLHVIDGPAVAMFAAALIGGLFVLGRR